MGEPLPVRLYETLLNFLNMYTYRDEEVLVLEAVANGIDAGAKNIDITFERKSKDRFIIFRNDAPGMTEENFKEYHTISFSTKTKGEGIGFAGVGAKIFLASSDGSEIITITGSGNKVLASRMYRQGKKIEYDSSLKVGLTKILGTDQIKPFNGTVYKVKLTDDGYNYLVNEIIRILQFWFNYAIIAGSLKLTVDGIKVEPWQPKGKIEKKILTFKNQKITCYFCISDDDIPEERRHIVYTVYGKRIKNEAADFAYEIVGDKSNKVFAIVDASILAKHLNSNKEDFMKNFQTNKVRALIKKGFYEFLKSEGLIRAVQPHISSNIVTNELTQRLDRLLQQDEFRFLNPWFSPRVKLVAVPDEGGDIVIKQVDDGQVIHHGQGGKGGGGIPTVGGEEGIGYVQDDEGDHVGKNVKTRARGIAIIVEEYPDDPREGWVDVENRGVVYNDAHPFAVKLKQSALFEYNLTRVVISALVKSANDKIQMDAKTGLETFEKVLHGSWL